jgi:DNA-binding NarL/FixJ family response regulator
VSGTGAVVVVARDTTLAARLEAAVREATGSRVEVASASGLPGLSRERPGAILVVALAGAESRRALRGLAGASPPPAIVVLTEQPARLWTSGWRALGLRAALPLQATPGEVAAAVRAVQTGLLVVHPEALAPAVPAAAPHGGRQALTSREREILELIAEGANNRLVAARLAISRHTVKFHVASILVKLGARSRTEAVTLGLRAGVLAV